VQENSLKLEFSAQKISFMRNFLVPSRFRENLEVPTASWWGIFANFFASRPAISNRQEQSSWAPSRFFNLEVPNWRSKLRGIKPNL